ncbi:hypothetical protein ACWCPX_43040 [Streptomyces olivaceoviridis]
MAGGTVVLLAVILSSLGHDTAVTMSVHLSAEDAALFGRHQIRNRVLWRCLGGVLAVQVAAVHLPWARSVFGTVPLEPGQ